MSSVSTFNDLFRSWLANKNFFLSNEIKVDSQVWSKLFPTRPYQYNGRLKILSISETREYGVYCQSLTTTIPENEFLNYRFHYYINRSGRHINWNCNIPNYFFDLCLGDTLEDCLHCEMYQKRCFDIEESGSQILIKGEFVGDYLQMVEHLEKENNESS